MKVQDPVEVYRKLFPSYSPSPAMTPASSMPSLHSFTLTERLSRSRSYTQTMPGSVTERDQGNCHNMLYQAACVLIHGFALSPNEAMPVLEEWNQKCVPPWSPNELQHKLTQANDREDSNGKPRGFLLAPDTSIVEDLCRREVEKFEGRRQRDDAHDYVPFPVDTLPEPLKKFIFEVSRPVGCDPAFLALPLLAALAAAIGDSRSLFVKNSWVVPCVLWTAFIGESGTAKSPALKHVLEYPKRWQTRLQKDYEVQLAEYQIAIENHEFEIKKWKKQLRGQPDLPMPALPQPPDYPRTTVGDITPEALVDVLDQNPRGPLCIHDELAGWIESFNKYRSGGDSDSPQYLSMYNGGPVSVDRKSSGHKYIPHAYLSITGGIQPKIFARCFSSKHRDSGLAARFLFAFPPRITKQWNEFDLSKQTDDMMESIFNYCFTLQPTVDNEGTRTPYLFGLDTQARAIWIDFFNRHNQEMVETEGAVAAAFSKLEEIPLRLAIVFHCVQLSSRTTTSNLVDADTITKAIALTDWFKNESKRIYSAMALEIEKTGREKLAEWIDEKGGIVTPRDLQRSNKKRYPNADTAKAALNDLVMTGLGIWEQTNPPKTGGRPSKHFRLTT